MLFPLRQQILNQYTGSAAVTNTISYSITRDFFLSAIVLRVPMTVAVSSGGITWTDLALAGAVSNLQLQIADGSSNRTQTNASGYALIQRAARILDGLDNDTLKCTAAYLRALETASAGSSAGTYVLSIPLLFKHPQISDPIGSATMLPLPRYNTNPNLTVQFNQLANLGSGTGFAVTFGTPYLVLNKRDVSNIQFPTLETEVQTITQTVSSTGTNILQELQVPGSYTMIDLYTTNASNVATDISGGMWSLQFLGQTLRQFFLSDLQMQSNYAMGNDLSYGAALTRYFPNFYHMDFLHDEFGMEVGELGSLLNANLLAGSGSRVQLIENISSTGNVNITWERIFGDLSGYTFNLATLAG